MNKEEAKQIISTGLEQFRTKPYSELVQMIDSKPITGERTGPSGQSYQIEIQAFWDGKPDGDIRVMCSIDDGGLRTFVPLTDDFIKSPSGDFVGE